VVYARVLEQKRDILQYFFLNTSHILSYHISYFHSVDPYRITKSIWICKLSYLLKKSRSESQYKSVQQL